MKKALIGLILGTSLVAFVGCGSNKTATYDAAAAEEAAMAYDSDEFGYEEVLDMASEYKAEPANGAEGGTNAETVGETSSSRKLITTVSIEAQALDFEECAVKVKEKVDQLGGYIEYESCGETYGEYTIRIPSKNLQSFLEKVEEYSNVTYHTSSVEDVTLSYVDIEARISTLRAEQQRLEEFMKEAANVEDMMSIEARLTDVRYELQSYESQKRTYDNKIDYSTVHLNLRAVSTYTAPEKGTIGERIKSGIAKNFAALSEISSDLLVGIVTIIPIIIVVLLPIGLLFLIIFLPINAANKKKEAKRRAENEAKANEAK